MSEIKPINLVAGDPEQTHKTDPSKEMYNVYLRLSASPPIEWTQIFDSRRSAPRHTMWRKAWVEGEYIVLHCPLSELKKYHVKDIKEDIQFCNEEYVKYSKERVIAQKEDEQKKKEDQERIRRSLSDLDL